LANDGKKKKNGQNWIEKDRPHQKNTSKSKKKEVRIAFAFALAFVFALHLSF
jgi:hypothetical protein